MCRIRRVTVFIECRPRRVERLRRPPQIARDQRDLGFGDDAPRTRYSLLPAERASRASHQRSRSRQITELRHRDATKSQCGWIVAQCDAFERAKRITHSERASRGCNQGVHWNPATLVTPTRRMRSGKSISKGDE